MLRHLRSLRGNRRRFLWFNCACCRRVWDVLTEPGRRFVEGVERIAEDTDKPLPHRGILWEGEQAVRTFGPDFDRLPSQVRGIRRCAAMAAWFIKHENNGTADWAAYAMALFAPKGAERYAARAAEQATQCEILRDLVGNPFHPLTFDPAWRMWNDGVLVRLAQLAYDERILPAGTLDNARLAVLADALEEAGCDDSRILTHMRGGGAHYRGCFVLDALLGK